MSLRRLIRRVLGCRAEPPASLSAAPAAGGFVCSFCGLASAQVVALIEAPERRAYVCDQCVDVCVDVLHERGYRTRGCVFCDTPPTDAAPLLEGPHGRLVCGACAAGCAELRGAPSDSAAPGGDGSASE